MSSPGARRGRPPTFGRRELLDAAAALIEREGLDACTLRATADQLGVTAMALYRHVDSKDELLALIPDHLLARHRRPDPVDATGPEALRHVAELLVETIDANPAAAPLFARPDLGLTMADAAEWCLERLTADGLRRADAGVLLQGTVALVIGLTVTGGSTAATPLAPIADRTLGIWLTGIRHRAS
ncbi:MAG: helix-turn-helix domain-containing protein [Actinomycetota bacterium]